MRASGGLLRKLRRNRASRVVEPFLSLLWALGAVVCPGMMIRCNCDRVLRMVRCHLEVLMMHACKSAF